MLSSWCQYEALSYVTFPTQTLSKSFKLVPIMLMGKMLTNKNYPPYEYAVAFCIGLGNTLFMVRPASPCREAEVCLVLR
jgi:solute carrier family 35 (adenosine 3'-phospho 5'-phosphosulfate transporter), member B2